MVSRSAVGPWSTLFVDWLEPSLVHVGLPAAAHNASDPVGSASSPSSADTAQLASDRAEAPLDDRTWYCTLLAAEPEPVVAADTDSSASPRKHWRFGLVCSQRAVRVGLVACSRLPPAAVAARLVPESDWMSPPLGSWAERMDL